MDWIINFFLSREFNDGITILFFWLPLVGNAIGYTLRVFERVDKDKRAIAGDKEYAYHNDWLKLGHIIGYILATLVPVVNCLWFVFDVMCDLWRHLWKRLDWLFEIRLVPGEKPKQP